MNNRKEQWIIFVMFCGFILGMTALYLLCPKAEFSQQEKRYLAQKPELSWETLSSGAFSEDVDVYLADHIPGRNFFVGLQAYMELLTGRQSTKDIWLVDAKRLAEAPVQPDETAVQKNMGVIHAFAEAAEVPVDLMLIPSAGWAAQLEKSGEEGAYRDSEMIQTIYRQADSRVQTVDIAGLFAQEEYPSRLYYRTDHHWTSRGAYLAYSSYMKQLGKPYPEESAYQVESVPDFRGSAYSRSALWLTPAETLELWHGPNPIAVTNETSTQPREGVFYRERLEEADKYTVFLDGNHSLVRLENPAGQGKLLVVRDSFSNCLGGFLADSYETVVLVDLRYYRYPVSELLLQESFDRVLVCYRLENFLTDTNIVWLR